MRIGIDASEANTTKRVGSNVYAYEVLRQLENQAKDDDVTVYLPSVPLRDMPKQRAGWEYRVIPPKKFWTQWRLPLALCTGKKLDVFYSLGHYAPRFCPCPRVVTIMDLAFLRFPDFFRKSDALKLTKWTSYSARKAKHIIAISENTKKDIQKAYGKRQADITVAYPGFTKKKVSVSPRTVLRQMNVVSPYILYVGTIQPRKNLVRAIKAFELIHSMKKHGKLRFVIAGKTGWHEEEFTKALQQSPARPHIRVLGYVTDEQKYALYGSAEASILVGLYEGFGIPPLESLAAGTTPVVSGNSSLPEVIGDAGVLVDPYDVKDIARGILEVVEYTPERKQRMRARGKAQVERFSWKETGRIILDVLHRTGGAA